MRRSIRNLLRVLPTTLSPIALVSMMLALTGTAKADTMSQAFPLTRQLLITIYKPRLSGTDADARALFETMNVPVQPGAMGPGKAVKDSTPAMSLACADRGADGHQCTIMIQKTAVSDVRMSPNAARFERRGADAARLTALFTPNQPDGTFKFRNSENTLVIEATPEHFAIQYQE